MCDGNLTSALRWQKKRRPAGQNDESRATLEGEAQSQLNLASASDGLVDVAQAKRAVVETVDLIACAASGWHDGRPCYRSRSIVLVLRNIIDGNIKAGSVGDVENVEAELQVGPFSDVGVLDEGNVHASLPRLPENIALASGEIGFVRIVHGNGAIQGTWLQDGNSEAIDVERRKAWGRTGVSRHGTFRGAT